MLTKFMSENIKYYQETYIPKSLLKHKRQELEYDQLENPRNICEDRIKIKFIDEQDQQYLKYFQWNYLLH